MEPHATETLDLCPICGAAGAHSALQVRDHSVSHEQFELTDCSSCGFRFTNPRPDSRSVGRFYDSDEYISHTNRNRTLADKVYHRARRWALRRKHALVAAHRSSGRVLDMGCGTGEFLGHLKSKGYVVTGVEPNLKAREQAIAHYAMPVLPALEHVPGLEQFHVVTLWHVLEHVHDLRQTLKRLYALMADGALLVIAVPDRESWDAQHYAAFWAAYDVPRHFSHFRRRDMRRLLIEHGFQMVAVKPMWLDAPYIAMLSERYLGRGPIGALFGGIIWGAWSNIVSAFTNRPTSSSLFLFRKASA